MKTPEEIDKWLNADTSKGSTLLRPHSESTPAQPAATKEIRFAKGPHKRPLEYCRGEIHWLTETEYMDVLTSGMFGEFYPGQPERWEDLPHDAAQPAATLRLTNLQLWEEHGEASVALAKRMLEHFVDLRAAYSNECKRLNACKSDLDAARRELEGLKAERENARKAAQNLRHVVNLVAGGDISEGEAVARLETNIQSHFVDAEQSMSALRAQLEASQKTVVDLTDELSAQTNLMDQQRTQLEEAGKEVEGLNWKLSCMKRDHDLEKDHGEKQYKNCCELQAALDKADSDLTAARARVVEMERERDEKHPSPNPTRTKSLWDYMSENHRLNLLESELNDLRQAVAADSAERLRNLSSTMAHTTNALDSVETNLNNALVLIETDRQGLETLRRLLEEACTDRIAVAEELAQAMAKLNATIKAGDLLRSFVQGRADAISRDRRAGAASLLLGAVATWDATQRLPQPPSIQERALASIKSQKP